MLITLPWPDKRLNPNARVHWGAKSTLTKKARKDAATLTFEAMPHGIPETRGLYAGSHEIPLHVFFFPPDKRHRDADNTVASAKALFDGIADALGVNDARFRPKYSFELPSGPGKIQVVL